MARATKKEEPSFYTDDCSKCGRPKGKYKKGRTNNERVICLRNSGAIVIEERGEVTDQKENIRTLLNELYDGSDKAVKLRNAVKTVSEALDAYTDDLGPLEPELFEVGKCSVEDVITELDQYRGCNTGFIPRDTVYFERTPIKNGSYHEIYVMSKPPGLVNFKYKTERTKERTYRLSLPYLNVLVAINVSGETYALDQSNTFMFLTKTPLESMDQKIYRFPSHNMHGDGAYCWGQVRTDTNLPKNRMVHGIMDLLFNSTWNDHIPQRNYDAIPAELGGSYDAWDKKSRENQYCGLKKEIQWQPLTTSKTTFAKLREEMTY